MGVHCQGLCWIFLFLFFLSLCPLSRWEIIAGNILGKRFWPAADQWMEVIRNNPYFISVKVRTVSFCPVDHKWWKQGWPWSSHVLCFWWEIPFEIYSQTDDQIQLRLKQTIDKNEIYDAFFDIFLFKSLQFQSPLKSSAECSAVQREFKKVLKSPWNPNSP